MLGTMKMLNKYLCHESEAQEGRTFGEVPESGGSSAVSGTT